MPVNEVFEMLKERTFPVSGELIERLGEIIHEYDGELSLCEVLGVLEVLKSSLIDDAKASI